MPSSSIGLYLGTETVDIVSLGGSFQKPRLINSGSLPLPLQGTWRSQIRTEETKSASAGQKAIEVTPDEGVLQTVKTLLQNTSLSAPRAHAAIASEAFIIRYFQMPTIPLRERKLAIAFEAKKYLPFKLEELVTDFQIVIHRKDPSLMRVMFFGIKRSSVAAILSLFKPAGLTPLCLETSPISLMRLLRQNGQLEPGQVAAVLTAEEETATISIARQDLLYLSRNVSIPGSAEAARGPSELMEALITETRVSIDYYRRRFLGEPSVSKVVLFGKNVDPQKTQELTSALGVPVEMGNTLQKTGATQEASPGLAIATGLALRGLEKKSWEPNLLPPEYRRNLQSLVKPVAFEAALAMALLGVWYGFTMADLRGLNQKITLIQLGLPKSVGLAANKSIQDLKTLAEGQQRDLQFLGSLSKSRINLATLLGELSRLLPQEAWVQSASIEDTLKKPERGALISDERLRTLKLAGAAYLNNREKELEGINNFLAALKSSALFKSTFSDFYFENVRRGRFREEEVTQFRLTCSSMREKKGPNP